MYHLSKGKYSEIFLFNSHLFISEMDFNQIHDINELRKALNLSGSIIFVPKIFYILQFVVRNP